MLKLLLITVLFSVVVISGAVGVTFSKQGYGTLSLLVSMLKSRVKRAVSRVRPGSSSTTHSCSNIRSVPEALRSATQMGPKGLSLFYQKYTEAYRIPVVGSTNVPDTALQRACYVLRSLLANRADVRDGYFRYFGRVAVMAASEVTRDIPEHSWLAPSWNKYRGLAATRYAPVTTVGEENVLCRKYPVDKYYSEDILVHELAHGIIGLGGEETLPGFNSHLDALYRSALTQGLWNNTYAATRASEYWAEGVQSYFGVNAFSDPPNGIHNHVNSSGKLRDYDPGLYGLVHEIFPGGDPFTQRCDAIRDVDPVCEDDNTYCAYWAYQGNCANPASYTSTHCPRSCDTCAGGGGGIECKNRSSACKYWASIGECVRNPGYMLFTCMVSCDSCKK